MRKGIAVSPGVAVGTAYCIHEIYVGPEDKPLTADEVIAELDRYERAVERTVADLTALYQKVASQIGAKEAAIFQVHESILRDPSFTSKVRNFVVRDHQTAQSALHHVLNEYTSLFARTKDDYLKERLADVRDVVIRLSGHLSEVLTPGSDEPSGPLIVVAEELLPSQVVMLGSRDVAGIVTQSGGQTSHAAILARSRGIPAVSGVRDIVRQVKNGDTLVVDGCSGAVIVNPAAEVESAYRKLQREFVDLKDHLAENRDLPAVSADGQPVELLANINSVADARAAKAMGGSGVGLYRTEYLFLTHPDVPDEEEQLAAYRQIIEESPGNRVTIRTLDLGGDKTIPYLGHAREANPFMGWRSIRLSFEHPEFFATQIRAVLRAAASRPGERRRVRLMFPMITTLEEMRRVRKMVRQAQDHLAAEGKECGQVLIGLMLEVPAAAISIESLLAVVDFVSIGSNDLVQYLMAADRDNPKVSHLCQPLSPPVLKVLTKVIRICNRMNKPVTLCGEMAGAPRAFVLLFAMGLRSFSMSPSFIPTIKELTSHLTVVHAQRILRHALRLRTTKSVQRFMAARLQEIAPNLKLLDTNQRGRLAVARQKLTASDRDGYGAPRLWYDVASWTLACLAGRFVARNEQLIRQHKLLQLLEQSRYGRSLTELRDDLVESLGLSQLSERTVRRDLEALQAAGFDVESAAAPRGPVWNLGRSLRGTTRIAATATELLALSMGRNLLSPLAGTPYWQGIESLWQKMKDSLPEPVWKHFNRRRASLVVRGMPAKSYERQQGVLATLNRAIAQRRVVRIEYQTLEQAAAATREIEPYALALHQGSLYVIAAVRGGERQETMRHFKLDRFRKATPLDERFAPREDFDPQRHFADSLGMFKAGEPQTFRLRLTPRAAAWLIEEPWHAEQRVEANGGDYLATIPKAYEGEVLPRVLSLGVDAELLSPASSRRALAAMLAKLAKQYE